MLRLWGAGNWPDASPSFSGGIYLPLRPDDHIRVKPVSIYVHGVLIRMVVLDVLLRCAGICISRIEVPGRERGFFFEDNDEVSGVLPGYAVIDAQHGIDRISACLVVVVTQGYFLWDRCMFRHGHILLLQCETLRFSMSF